MAAAALAAWLLAATAALLLWLRLRAAERRVAAVLGGARGPLPEALRAVVPGHADRTLLAAADHDGLAGLPVPWREPKDPYATADTLLAHLVTCEPRARLEDHQARVRAVYHLAATLALPAADTDRLLAPVLAALRRATFMDRPVGTVTRVSPGDLVDRRRMWPLTQGTRVRHPLGVVVRDQDGRVVSRARVVCG